MHSVHDVEFEHVLNLFASFHLKPAHRAPDQVFTWTLQQGLPTEQRATDFVAGYHPCQLPQPRYAVHGVSDHGLFSRVLLPIEPAMTRPS